MNIQEKIKVCSECQAEPYSDGTENHMLWCSQNKNKLVAVKCLDCTAVFYIDKDKLEETRCPHCFDHKCPEGRVKLHGKYAK